MSRNPQTKLWSFFDGIMEASCVLAVMLVPVFFNIFSARSFEPDKAYLLRTLAACGLAAWIMRAMETVRTQEKEGQGTAGRLAGILRLPMVAPIALLLVVFLISVFASVLPGISIWGSYERKQGLFTFLSYIAVFITIAGGVSRPEQVRRLVGAIILASVPVSVYGIFQATNPALTGGDQEMFRANATMGNPIFLGAYLIMVLPLTLTRLIAALSEDGNGWDWPKRLPGVLFYAAVFLLQFICLLFTQSRGPFLAMLAGLFFFFLFCLIALARGSGERYCPSGRDALNALIFAVASIPAGAAPAYCFFLWKGRGFRWLWMSLLFQGAMVILLMAGLGMTAGRLPVITDIPYLQRLGHLLNKDSDTVKVRVLIWEGSIRLLGSSPGRSTVGYGPETMKLVWAPYSSERMTALESRHATADRSHNETLDVLVTGGVAGLAGYMALVIGILYYGLAWLGFLTVRRQKILFALSVAAGAFAGFFVPRVLFGSYTFSFVGLPVGILLGLLVHVVVSVFMFPVTRTETRKRGDLFVLAALFSAVAAHLVESHVGISTVATRLYLFAFAALTVVVGGYKDGGQTPEAIPAQTEPAKVMTAAPKRKGAKRGGRPVEHQVREGVRGEMAERWQTMARYSVILAVLLFTTGFSFIVNPLDYADVFSIIGDSFTKIYVGAKVEHSSGLFLILFFGLLAGAFLFREDWTVGVPSGGKASGAAGSVALVAAGAAAVTLIAFLFEASFLGPDADPGTVVIVFYSVVLVLMVLVALTRVAWGSTKTPFSRAGAWWVYPIVAACAAWFVYSANVAPARADVYQRAARSAERKQDLGESLRWYSRAAAAEGDEEFYFAGIARASFAMANGTANITEKTTLFRRTLEALEQARSLNPLNPDHLSNLGMLYTAWAMAEPNAETRKGYLDKAGALFAEASAKSPYKAAILNNWARADMLKGDYGQAAEKLQRSLAVDPEYAQTRLLLGEVYARQGKVEEGEKVLKETAGKARRDPDSLFALAQTLYRQGKIKEALDPAREAAELRPDHPAYHMLLNIVYFRLGNMDAALREGLKVLELQPQNVVARRNVAVTYARLGRLEEGARQMEEAARRAPEAERPALQRQAEEMRQQAAAGGGGPLR